MRIKYLINSLRINGLLHTINTINSGYFKLNKFIVFHLEVSKKYKKKINNLKFMKISIEELKSYRQHCPHLPIQFFCDLSHNFKNPYIAAFGNKIVAIDWLVFPGETSRFLDLDKNEVEMNYNVVLPEFQGKEISRYLKEYMINDCISQAIKRIYVVVNVENIPQCKILIRLGFEPVEVLTHFMWWRPKAKLKYVKQRVDKNNRNSVK
ncbi:MAG: hypothetical protein DRI74_09340 [Bacteroidetes bacterium]|nr:MAG: hypothetical protein DRI74_09340 [Bacteroidota bacterium]